MLISLALKSVITFHKAKHFQDSPMSFYGLIADLFLLLNNIPLNEMDMLILFIHSSVGGHFDFSHFLTSMNNVAMSIHVQVFL